jgi:phage antirepressor YoqD-like protein
MNEIAKQGDSRMTVKEVAEAFGCNPETVKGHIRELFPGLMQNGKATLLDDKQATIILESIKKSTAEHRGLESINLQRSVAGIETGQRRALRIELLHRQIETELEAEIAELKEKAEADRPKVEFFDQVAESRDALQMRDVAAALNIPDLGRNKIFEVLRKKGVLDDRNIPYREYQDRGYFRVIEQKWTDKEGETHISLKPLVYQRGIDFIRKVLRQGKAV